jgi:hypothetical protein
VAPAEQEARLQAAARFVRRLQIREQRSAQPVPPEQRSEPALPAAVRCALMAAARLFRPRAAEVERSFALTRAGCPMGVAVVASGQAPSSPAADRRAEESEHRSQAQSLPEALACRQCLAAAEAPRLARSSAAAWAQRWAAPVALAAAAVAQRSGQTAA